MVQDLGYELSTKTAKLDANPILTLTYSAISVAAKLHEHEL